MRFSTALAHGVFLALMVAPCLAPPAWPQTPAPPQFRRVVLLRPDTAKAPSFPDTSWIETAEVSPDQRAGVRLEVIADDPPAAAAWLRMVDVYLYQSAGPLAGQTVLLAPTFFHPPVCVSGDCRSGGVFAAFGYAGIVPRAERSELRLRFRIRDDSAAWRDTMVLSAPRRDTMMIPAPPRDTMIRVPLWVHPKPRFAMGGSAGAAVPLNTASGQNVVRRLGMNGRLLVFTVPGIRSLESSRVLRGLLRGPVVLEGDFLLGVASFDTTAAKDSAATFRSSTEGSIRFEWPLFEFAEEVSWRAYLEGGFVTLQSLPDYWSQRYWGFRLGMDAADLSGRQSYVDIAFGHSDNLRPRFGRLRVAVQLVIPRTQLVVQFKVNYNRRTHIDPTLSDSPVVLSAFTSLDWQSLYRLISGGAAP